MTNELHGKATGRVPRLSNAPSVRDVAADDIPRLAAVLARAFHTEPLISWILPHEARRLRNLPRLYAMWLRDQFAPHSQLVTLDGDIAAGAMWSPPDRWRAPRRSELRQLPSTLRLTRSGMGRLVSATTAMARAHPEEPHWYLADLGTDPNAQRMGLGRLLLEAGLARCDDDNRPAYLETTTQSNVRYYERFGFAYIDEVRLRGGPPLYTMWRASR